MALRLAAASDAALDQILRDTYPVWGGGLSFDAYAKYQAAERRTPWGQTHIERMALFDNTRLLASAKRYDLTARIDGRIRRVLGLGSLFTPKELRGRGAASAMIAHLVDAANTEGFEFVQLFSDSRLENMARRQFQSKVLVRPRRGNIVDRTGEPLVYTTLIPAGQKAPTSIR